MRLPGTDDVVTLIAVKAGPFWTLTYEGSSGLGQVTLSEEELSAVELVERYARQAFDANPHDFRLGVEAHRIKVAFAHDMAALAVSNIQPLPHQLEAY